MQVLIDDEIVKAMEEVVRYFVRNEPGEGRTYESVQTLNGFLQALDSHLQSEARAFGLLHTQSGGIGLITSEED